MTKIICERTIDSGKYKLVTLLIDLSYTEDSIENVIFLGENKSFIVDVFTPNEYKKDSEFIDFAKRFESIGMNALYEIATLNVRGSIENEVFVFGRLNEHENIISFKKPTALWVTGFTNESGDKSIGVNYIKSVKGTLDYELVYQDINDSYKVLKAVNIIFNITDFIN